MEVEVVSRRFWVIFAIVFTGFMVGSLIDIYHRATWEPEVPPLPSIRLPENIPENVALPFENIHIVKIDENLLMPIPRVVPNLPPIPEVPPLPKIENFEIPPPITLPEGW